MRDSLDRLIEDPGGVQDCSHGWSPPRADETRGQSGFPSSRPEGAEEGHAPEFPPPLTGRFDGEASFSTGSARPPLAGGTPPVAATRGPIGAESRFTVGVAHQRYTSNRQLV